MPAREEVRASPAPEDPAAAEPRFLSGIVTERSGAPVAGAECLLFRGTSASGFSTLEQGDGNRLHASALSGEDGTFRLEAGLSFWRVAVRCAGYAPWESDHLVAGETLLVRLDPVVQVLFSVVGPAGEAVAGAEVSVRDAGDVSPEAVRERARTDPAGRALIADLAPGTWLVTVRHPAYAAADARLEIPVGLFRIDREVRLDRGTRLAGTVRTSGGAPIAGARVRVESPYREVVLVEEALSDPSGRYATEPLFSLQETLEVLATAEGHAETSVLLGIQPEHVRAGEAVVDLVLAESGRTLVGRAVDGERAGVPGASVRIAALDSVGSTPEDVLASLQAAPGRPCLWQEVARTDGTGRFEVRDLSTAPQYVLLIVREPFAPRMVWAPPGEAGSVTELGELELLAWGGLFGRALRADGSPAGRETLRLYQTHRVMTGPGREGLEAWRPQSWFPPHETRTREDGAFRFDTLSPGTYELLPAGLGRFEIEAGRSTGPVEIVIPGEEPGGKIELSGVVRDRAGNPVPMVFVRAYAPEGSGEALASSGLAGEDGTFALRVPAIGGLRLSFTDLRGEHEERDVFPVSAPLPSPLEVVLEARAERLPPVEGVVLGPTGEPVEGCVVRLHPPEDGLCSCISFQTRTDAAGAFRFESVSEGPHRIVVSDARFATAIHYPAKPGDQLVIELQGR